MMMPEDELAALEAARGYRAPEYDLLARHDPEHHAVRRQLVANILNPSDPELPIVIRELIISAILAYRGHSSLIMHLRRALKEGASFKQLVEAMEVASLPGGAPTLHFALQALEELESELDDESG